MLARLDVRRHTDPAGYNSKIIHLDPLDTAILDKYIMLDSGWIDRDTHFFLRLTQCTLTEELSLLHLASWECPESWPCIEFDPTSDQKYMGTMETDRVCSGCDELGHRERNK
jgi:hypothetical protein